MADINIYGVLKNATPENVIAVASLIKDETMNKTLEAVNKSFLNGENLKTINNTNLAGVGDIKLVGVNVLQFTETEELQIKSNLRINDKGLAIEYKNINQGAIATPSLHGQLLVNSVLPVGVKFIILDISYSEIQEALDTPELSIVLSPSNDFTSWGGAIAVENSIFKVNAAVGEAERDNFVSIIVNTTANQCSFKLLKIRYSTSSGAGFFKGHFSTKGELTTAYPTSDKGAYAYVGNPRHLYIYNTSWVDNGILLSEVENLLGTRLDVGISLDLSTKLITEYNVSKHHPTEGIEGTNKFTLETAIKLIPESLRSVGIKCSFLDESNSYISYKYTGNVFLEASSWTRDAGPELYNYNLFDLTRNKDFIKGYYDAEAKIQMSDQYIATTIDVSFVDEITVRIFFDGPAKCVLLSQSGEILHVFSAINSISNPLLIDLTKYQNRGKFLVSCNAPDKDKFYIIATKLSDSYSSLLSDTTANIMDIKHISEANRGIVTDDIGYSYNIVSVDDIYPNGIWDSGEITKIGNEDGLSVVHFTAKKNGYEKYCTAFLTNDTMKKRGINVKTNNLDISVKCNRNTLGVWVALRYNIDDKKTFEEYGQNDVVFNRDGNIQGLGADDKDTWRDVLTKFTYGDGKSEFNISNLNIPDVYQEKKFYALLVCFQDSGNDDSLINEISVSRFASNKYIVKTFYSVDKKRIEENSNDIATLRKDVDNIRVDVPFDVYWAACGDSLTNANHNTIFDIDVNDKYMPLDGYANVSTYKRKNYAYYIAKKNRIKWANYGWGGTTLGICTSKAFGNKNAFVDKRMYSLKEGIVWDIISIFFGDNDFFFGPTAKRDQWLKEKYGTDIGYPDKPEQIGTSGFANQEQKDECDKATGMVGEVNYTNNNDYFIAKYIGTIDDTGKDTFYGAYNNAIQYLQAKYPKAKLVLIAPYYPPTQFADAVVAVAKKWSLTCFDFRNVPYWPIEYKRNNMQFPNPTDSSGKWVLECGTKVGDTIYFYQSQKYLYDGEHPTNLGYKTMSAFMEDAIIK